MLTKFSPPYRITRIYALERASQWNAPPGTSQVWDTPLRMCVFMMPGKDLILMQKFRRPRTIPCSTATMHADAPSRSRHPPKGGQKQILPQLQASESDRNLYRLAAWLFRRHTQNPLLRTTVSFTARLQACRQHMGDH